MLVRAGLPLPDVPYFCTETAAQWLYPDQPDFTLEHLALRMTSVGQWRPTVGKLKPDDFDQMSDEELADRCGGDADAPVHLYPPLAQEIDRTGLRPVWDLAMDVLPILATIGGTGMAVDRETLKERAETTVGPWLTQEKADLQQALGIANLDSHQQLSEALYGPRFHATPLRKTRTQGYSTDRTCLLWARYQAQTRRDAALVALLTRLLEYSVQEKVHSTYYKAWSKAGRPRVHSFYSLGRTATGRLASYQYNLQNVPSVARELIVPSEGYDCIVQADFAQLEWRIAGHLSQDPVMLQWIRQGRDVHAITAARALGLREPQTKADFVRFKAEHKVQRDVGKMTNFAVLYGISADSLSWKIFHDTEGAVWLPPDEVQHYIDAFFRTFAGYKAFTTHLAQRLSAGEQITSPFQRQWYFPSNPEGWRKAMNYPVQSMASDLVLLVLRRLARILRSWKTRIIGEVHDSLVFETVKEERAPLIRLIRQVCEHPSTRPFGFTLAVPLTIEIARGPTWAKVDPL